MKRCWTGLTVASLLAGVLFSLAVRADQADSGNGCRASHEVLSPLPLEASVHEGLDCAACHPGAESVPHEAPVIDFTACTGCHPDARPYWESVHGRAFEQGIAAVPSCADCHGSHQMQPVSDPSSPVYPINLPQTCGGCHENAALSERFGLPSQRYTTYIDSYHGILLKEGRLVAASATREPARTSPKGRSTSRRDPGSPPGCGRCACSTRPSSGRSGRSS